MSEHIHYFESTHAIYAVSLPFDIRDIVKDWSSLRSPMLRDVPAEFTRDEWAYLVTFLSKENLFSPFEKNFGTLSDESNAAGAGFLARPRGRTALWLPNNVSLLGPLMLVMISLTGNELSMKSGSQSHDLTHIFLDYAVAKLPDCPLRSYLAKNVSHARFDRADARNAEMSASSTVRIFFGSDEAAEEVEALPHRPGTLSFHFTDRRSEAWIEKSVIDDRLVETLIKVFTIYGRAGCTSPRRVVIIGGSQADAEELQSKIVSAWQEVIRSRPEPHIASENVLAKQLSMALGWKTAASDDHASVIASGDISLPECDSNYFLAVTCASLEEAAAALPPNIQTVGYAASPELKNSWLATIAKTSVKRFVPVADMHHFGHIWDGYPFWRLLFEEVETS